MVNFEVIIGIEIHLELNTKTKMFSRASNNFRDPVNTSVLPLDLGYPGTLPILNYHAIYKAIRLAKALGMQIDHEIHFDRKNYFYFDLPKGYQITQQFRPFAKTGKLPINEQESIAISHFHLEEDTARVIHHDHEILLDYNRAGVPLIEIVSEPCLRNSDQAVAYINMIAKLALALDISDAKMEEGSLRADLNISIRPRGSKTFGTKVEIKNLNSLSNVRRAIELEIKNQVQDFLLGQPIVQATKRFDEVSNTNILMRLKGNAIDYKYFPEPNLTPIVLSQTLIDQVKIPELPWEQKARYVAWGIEPQYVEQLLNNLNYSRYFDAINFKDKISAARIFFAEVIQLANALNILDLFQLGLTPLQFSEILALHEAGELSGPHLKKLIPLVVNEQLSVDELRAKYQLKQIDDENFLQTMIDKFINENEAFINANHDRPDRVKKFILGLVMKATQGQANPIKANKLLADKLELKG